MRNYGYLGKTRTRDSFSDSFVRSLLRACVIAHSRGTNARKSRLGANVVAALSIGQSPSFAMLTQQRHGEEELRHRKTGYPTLRTSALHDCPTTEMEEAASTETSADASEADG